MEHMKKILENMVKLFKESTVYKENMVFKKKFNDLLECEELVKDCNNNNVRMNFKDISEYWTGVGQYDLEILNDKGNILKKYEIILHYTYPETDSYYDGYFDGEDETSDYPDVPTLTIECIGDIHDSLHIA